MVLGGAFVAGDRGNGYQIGEIGADPIGLNDWVHGRLTMSPMTSFSSVYGHCGRDCWPVPQSEVVSAFEV